MRNWKKWLQITLLAGALAVGTVMQMPETVSARGGYNRIQTVAEEERQESIGNTPMLRDTNGKDEDKVDPKAWKKINGVCYNGSGKKIPGAITRGIDVSEWQEEINWKKVKGSNVDFAFVRIAHGVDYVDKKYEYNMKQAELAGVPVGTYVYSTALTNAQALKEARLAIEKMKGYKVSYPVVFDLEYSKMGELTPGKVSDLALTFCNEIRKAGYYPMVYCNTNWYDYHVDWSKLTGIDVWIARYGDTIQAPSSIDYNYTIWQSTDGDGGGRLNSTKGLIDGIPLWNNIDLDFGYFDYTKKIVPRWNPVSTYKPSSKPDTSTDKGISTGKNGWAEENGKTYYYIHDAKIKGWKKIEGKYYYFNSNSGAMYRDALLTSGNNNTCYLDKDGVRVSNQWVDWKDKRYYMASTGYAVKGWKLIGGKYYYFDSKAGYLLTDKKIISKTGDIYYVGKDGARYTDGFYKVKHSGKTYTYYFGKDGVAYKGWHTINKKKYYFYNGTSVKSGTRAENITLTSGSGVVSVFDKNGVCIKQYRKKK